MRGHTTDQLLCVCRHYIDQGFAALKLKIGAELRQNGYSKACFDADAAKVVGVMAQLPHDVQVDVAAA